MKSCLLFLAFSVLISGATFSQSIKLVYQGSQVVSSGYVYKVGSASTSDIDVSIWVQNNTADTLIMRVTTVEVDVVPGTLNATCWDVCPPADTAGQSPIRTSPPLTIMPGAYEYSFAPHLYPENIPGCSQLRYIFFADNSTVTDSVDVYFNHGVACSAVSSTKGLENQIASFDVFPNPATDYVNIALGNKIKNGELVISNVLGQVISRNSVTEASGNIEIPVTNMENGFYFVSLVLDDKTTITRKFQVAK